METEIAIFPYTPPCCEKKLYQRARRANVVEFTEALLGIVFGLVLLWALHRLSVIGRAALALRGAETTEPHQYEDGQQIAVDGQVIVDEAAPVAERIFDHEGGTVGAYIWHAWFSDAGSNIYDFDRGELRAARSTFASGFEAGHVAITTGDQPLQIDLGWFESVYDPDRLAALEIGDPRSNTKLPTFMTRYLWDSLYVSLSTVIGDCSLTRLVDVVDQYRDDVDTDEFNIAGRGITAGKELFVHGELQVRNGEYRIVGTDKTPLIISDTGRTGYLKGLLWRAIKYLIAAVGAIGLTVAFVL